MKRREFLKSGVSVSAFVMAPRHVLGGLGQNSPSEKLNVACIGVGGKGFDNLRNVSTENIVALCDDDTERATTPSGCSRATMKPRFAPAMA